MTTYALPFLFALFVWWFSTGVIVFLDGLPRRTYRWSMLGATTLLVAALLGIAGSAQDNTIWGAYAAFVCALAVWGWNEMAFLMGILTGPRRRACHGNCGGLAHFGHAVQTILHHELAILASGAVILALSWNANNQVAAWTFLVLWLMRLSAKLNVFLGVPNLSEEFLPRHLDYLKSYFARRPMNLLFPVSITISTTALTLLVSVIVAPGVDEHLATGGALTATLLALAILEHWLLVLPLPAASLWSWGLKSHGATREAEEPALESFDPHPASLLNRR